MPALLELRDLHVRFRAGRRRWGRPASYVHAVNGVDLRVERGSAFGLIGESGSGKSTTALAALGLIHRSGGSVRLDDVDLSTLPAQQMRALRRRMQIVFQDPYSSLNPRFTAAEIVAEPLAIQNIGTRQERQQRVDALFAMVGLRQDQQHARPHQLSGGQRQRVAIARALATSPELLVCDEPVSALDVVIQAQILNLLKRLRRQLGLTYLLISHDFGVVQYMCDEVAVMYLGRIVEQAPSKEIFSRPLHPYTQALMAAVPRAGSDVGGTEGMMLRGDPPNPIDLVQGCGFAGRCPYAVDRCRMETPTLRTLAPRQIACHRVAEDGTFV